MICTNVVYFRFLILLFKSVFLDVMMIFNRSKDIVNY